MVVATDAATLKALKDNLGKTYIAGKVTAIDVDNAKMTVERPDKVTQTIGFDETTSFKRGRGCMTLAALVPGIRGPQTDSAAAAGQCRRKHHPRRHQGGRQRLRARACR